MGMPKTIRIFKFTMVLLTAKKTFKYFSNYSGNSKYLYYIEAIKE